MYQKGYFEVVFLEINKGWTVPVIVLRWIWTGYSKKNYWSGINIGGEHRLVFLNHLSLVGVGSRSRSFKSQMTVLVELADPYCSSKERYGLQDFEKRERKKRF